MPRADLRALLVCAAVLLAIVVSAPRERPAPRPEPTLSAGTHVTSAERPGVGPENAQGIDVADHQHSDGPIRWKVVASQYQFAFVKATEGTSYVNRYYASDSRAALAAGMDVGGYAFATPDDASGAAEARYFLHQSRYSRGRTLLTPMLDIEWNPYDTSTRCYGLDPPGLTAWISSYSNTIYKALGVRPIIYTQASFWNKCTGGTNAFAESPLWVGSDASASSTAIPGGFTAWAIWQNVGSAAGVDGPVDIDAFNGTKSQLESELTVKGSPRDQPLDAYATSLRR